MHVEGAEGRSVLLFRIARMAHLRGNFRDSHFHSDSHHLRSGENLGRSGKHRIAETLLDYPVVLYVPVGKDTNHNERHREKSHHGNAHDGIARQQAAFRALSTASRFRDFQLNGHEESDASSTRTIGSPKRVVELCRIIVDSKSRRALPPFGCVSNDGRVWGRRDGFRVWHSVTDGKAQLRELR